MSELLTPTFTEEYGLYYLWKPEPQTNQIQLSGEFKSEAEMQRRSLEIFGVEATQRTA